MQFAIVLSAVFAGMNSVAGEATDNARPFTPGRLQKFGSLVESLPQLTCGLSSRASAALSA
ncbi:MAG UNVERIFIED_CONTAM: hypothetical protein LVR18_13255 [Planctomycetaceae bacterium]